MAQKGTTPRPASITLPIASVINGAFQRKTDYSVLTGAVTKVFSTDQILITHVRKDPVSFPMEKS